MVRNSSLIILQFPIFHDWQTCFLSSKGFAQTLM
jgi:hypothetical protein